MKGFDLIGPASEKRDSEAIPLPADKAGKSTVKSESRAAVTTTDGFFVNRLNVKVAYTVYAPRSGDFDEVILVVSAMGAQREKYADFSAFLATRSVVVTFDPAGTGGSMENSRNKDIRLTDWASDLECLIEFLADRYTAKVICVGHSIGGQLIGLINQTHIKKAVLIAAQNGYWKNWRVRYRYLMLVGWGLIYINTKLCKGLTLTTYAGLEKIPAGVSLDWIRWAMSESFYDRNGKNLDGRFSAFTRPLLYIGATDDEIYAPLKAGESLLNKYSKAVKQVWIMSPKMFEIKKIGHSGFFMDHIGESLWKNIWAWMRS